MQSNDETNVPLSELTSMCQTKQEVDQTKDVHYPGESFIFPPFAYHDTRNPDRNVTKTVPIGSYSSVCHRATRNHRGNNVHFSMGVYENEPPKHTVTHRTDVCGPTTYRIEHARRVKVQTHRTCNSPDRILPARAVPAQQPTPLSYPVSPGYHPY